LFVQLQLNHKELKFKSHPKFKTPVGCLRIHHHDVYNQWLLGCFQMGEQLIKNSVNLRRSIF